MQLLAIGSPELPDQNPVVILHVVDWSATYYFVDVYRSSLDLVVFIRLIFVLVVPVALKDGDTVAFGRGL